MTTASGMSTVKSKNTTKAGLAVETMSAPNPFCPNTKGVCCLMVLTNLSLILICIGFIIVLQLTDPPVVWYVANYVELINFDTSDSIGCLYLKLKHISTSCLLNCFRRCFLKILMSILRNSINMALSASESR